jgi:uncharacterized membrane protein YeaQ/YmgE (transglycosylase-associated protein family)
LEGQGPAHHPWTGPGTKADTIPVSTPLNEYEGEHNMSIISWIIMGLIAGAIARLILPGDQGGGWLGALITGILGAILGGWIGGLLFNLDLNESFWSFWTWVFAIIGGIIVAFIWQAITRRRGSRV